MPCNEIVTLQFGHYSNFIGTHWWNIQESGFDYNNSTESSEIDHDVLFREGLTPKGEVTFTPRLLLVDLKGSLKSLPKNGELYEEFPSEVHWDENLITKIEEKRIEKHEFQTDLDTTTTVGQKDYNFDGTDTVWSDFLYTQFHPRSVNILNEYQHNDTKIPFDIYPSGTALWKTQQFDDFQDKIRNYMEECENSQGFQLILDSTDGFSGLSASCLEYLNDEYSSKSVLAFPVIPTCFKENSINDSLHLINLALCYHSLSVHSSLFVPLSLASKGWRETGPERKFNHTNYNNCSPYHTSAILASALDTFTLSYRLKSKIYSLTDLRFDLGINGRKSIAASLCLPFSINWDQDLIDCLNNWEGPLSNSITPSYQIDERNVSQLITLRGVPENRLKGQTKSQKDMPAYDCNSVKEMLSYYVACNSYSSPTNVFAVSKGLPTKVPYPNKIFDGKVGKYGNIENCLSSEIVVESVPVLAGLHNGSNVGHMLESLINETKRIKFKRFHQFRDGGGIEDDEFNECLSHLMEFRECYQDNYLL